MCTCVVVLLIVIVICKRPASAQTDSNCGSLCWLSSTANQEAHTAEIQAAGA